MAVRRLERVPVERIEEQARPVDLGRLLLILLIGVFYAIGWIAGKAVVLLGVMLGWVLAAVKTGWQDARRPPEGRRRE